MYHCILVPIDGSVHAERALNEAITLCQNSKTKIQLAILHVNPTIAMNEPPVGVDLEEYVQEEDQEVVVEAKSRLLTTGIDYTSTSKNGDPAKVICGQAQEMNADLIIMGSRGLGLMSEMFIGSVSHSVVQHAHCPVMIVK
ncbi:universal stress protein [Paenibacillus pini]|uniref:UspA protein n=1 Tax=Paenibacillus pini JCM 16418 TaxID=1236976 RepID=W7YFY1_9BACL|nr:universal stress protein [Paenibacillus pini]GAF06443.1 UspA protein [Paenibacillus pini JCM 16418]